MVVDAAHHFFLTVAVLQLEAGKFYLARVSTLLIDMGLMFIFVTKLGVNDKIMKLIVQVIVIVLNYIFSKFIVFKEKKNETK